MLSLAGAVTSIFFVATNVLSRQIFVATNIIFVASKTRILSQQKTSFVATKYACRDKTFGLKTFGLKTFVATKLCFTTKVLSRQAYFCRDKNDTCGSSSQ